MHVEIRRAHQKNMVRAEDLFPGLTKEDKGHSTLRCVTDRILTTTGRYLHNGWPDEADCQDGVTKGSTSLAKQDW